MAQHNTQHLNVVATFYWFKVFGRVLAQSGNQVCGSACYLADVQQMRLLKPVGASRHASGSLSYWSWLYTELCRRSIVCPLVTYRVWAISWHLCIGSASGTLQTCVLQSYTFELCTKVFIKSWCLGSTQSFRIVFGCSVVEYRVSVSWGSLSALFQVR